MIPTPKNRKPKSVQREVYLNELLKMYLRGLTTTELSLHFQISPAQISSDIRQIRSRYEKNSLTQIEEFKLRELDRIDMIEKEAWEQFERSKEERAERISRSRKQTDKSTQPGEKGKKISTSSSSIEEEKQEKKTESIGDAKLLQIINDCRKDRMKILGLVKSEDDGGEKKFTFIIGKKSE